MKLEIEIKDDCSKWQLGDRVYDLMTSYRIEFIVSFHYRFVNFDNEHEKRKRWLKYYIVGFKKKALKPNDVFQSAGRLCGIEIISVDEIQFILEGHKCVSLFQVGNIFGRKYYNWCRL